jgi:hypothetical protein
MRGQTVTIAAAGLLSALPSAFAGKAKVYNHCDFPVYSWSVDTEYNPKEATIIEANGGLYEENFRKPAIGGVSIKLAPSNSLGIPITQLEYTVNSDLWYDVSNVDCTGTECPFQKHGLYLESGPGCPTVSCIPGNLTCHGAYTLWDDNWASLCCTEVDSDAVLHLCRHSADEEPSEPPASPSSYENGYYSTPTPVYKPKKHHHKSTPTTYEPATSLVEVTQYATVVVTVTPEAKPDARRRRHIHNHMDVHRRH